VYVCVLGGVGGYMGGQFAVGGARACVCVGAPFREVADFTYPLGLHGK
jgi:hypothetical protein